jgi:hypothetical protein
MDTNSLIDSRLLELQELYSRMDATKNLVYLTPYTLMKLDGKSKIERAISVTMNNPAVFANAVISDLVQAKRQIVVEGLTDEQNHDIETFGENAFAQADEILTRRSGQSGLWGWLCNHVCIRATIGARWITTFVNNEFTVDCLPVDMRYCPYVFGRDGLKWAANISYRDASSIKEEYPTANVTGRDIEVRDYWDCEKNEVWIDGRLALRQNNPFEKVPFVIVLPATGFMLRDKGYLAHEAEDLLAFNRGLYDELNRTVSIEQTLGMDIIEPAMEQESSDGDLHTDELPLPGQTLKVKKGERHLLVPRGDLNNATVTARQDIQKAIEQGGINDIDLGNVSQRVSAVWITEQTIIRSKFEEPRLQALATFYQQAHRMLIEQTLKTVGNRSDLKVNVGKAGKKRGYSPQRFGDPTQYTITYRYMTHSKKEEIANLAIAQAARGILPLSVILKDILMAEDPAGIMRELETEEAHRADPAIALFEMALQYAEEAESLEEPEADIKKLQSMMLTERGCSVIQQQRGVPTSLQNNNAANGPIYDKANSKTLLSLTGETGG